MYFKDPAKIKKQDRPDKPKDGKPDVWNFEAPSYDQRSSSFIRAGVDYGVGYRQPVGHEGNGTMNSEVLPRGTKNIKRGKF